MNNLLVALFVIILAATVAVAIYILNFSSYTTKGATTSTTTSTSTSQVPLFNNTPNSGENPPLPPA